jgi:small-conductance mechanosensitive channel
MGRNYSALLAEALDPTTLVGALVYALLFAILALILTRVVHFVVRRGTRYLSDPTAGSFLAQFLQVVVVVGALILYAHAVPALRSVGSALLTGASVGAVVLGLAAQNTLGNLIAGFSILLYHPFRLGDDVEINTPKGVMRGTIAQLTLGYTTLHASTQEQIIVPNSVMASAVLIRSVPGANDGSSSARWPGSPPGSPPATGDGPATKL